MVMKCSDVKKLLMPFVEGALDESLAHKVGEHLKACSDCAREAEALAETVTALREADVPAMEPAANMRSRVMAGIASEPVRRGWWTGRVQAWSAAAAVVLFAGVLMVSLRHGAFEGAPQSAMESLDRAEPPAAYAPAAPLEESAPEPELNDRIVMKEPSKEMKKSVSLPEEAPVRQEAKEKSPVAEGEKGAALGRKDAPAEAAAEADKFGFSPAAETTAASKAEPAPAAPSGGGDSLDSVAAGDLRKAEANGAAAVDEAKKPDDRTLELEKTLSENPDHEGTLLALVKDYRRVGRSQDEYAVADRLTKLKPDNAGYWFMRAQAAERAKLPNEAAASYKKAIELKVAEPNLSLSRSRLEVLEKSTGSGEAGSR